MYVTGLRMPPGTQLSRMTPLQKHQVTMRLRSGRPSANALPWLSSMASRMGRPTSTALPPASPRSMRRRLMEYLLGFIALFTVFTWAP